MRRIYGLILVSVVIFQLHGCAFAHHQYKTDSVASEPIGKTIFENCQPNLEGDSTSKSIGSYYLFHQSNCGKINKENGDSAVKDARIPDVQSNYGNYTFGVIEFDDYGELFDNQQLIEIESAVQLISAERPVVFVLFIHGWRNNASEHSSNLRDFRKFVQGLGNSACLDIWNDSSVCEDQLNSGNVRPHVVGIYAAWRGDPFNINDIRKYTGDTLLTDIIKQIQLLSIYDRKKAAKRVATTKATNVILRLIQAVETGDKLRETTITEAELEGSVTRTFYDSKKFLIGHSFGARFLENALAQSFLGRKQLSNQLDLIGQISNISSKLNRLDGEIVEVFRTFHKLDSEKQTAVKKQDDKYAEKARACKVSKSQKNKVARLRENSKSYTGSNKGLRLLSKHFVEIQFKIDELLVGSEGRISTLFGRYTSDVKSLCAGDELSDNQTEECKLYKVLSNTKSEYSSAAASVESIVNAEKTTSKEISVIQDLLPSSISVWWSRLRASAGSWFPAKSPASETLEALKSYITDQLDILRETKDGQAVFDHSSEIQRLHRLSVESAKLLDKTIICEKKDMEYESTIADVGDFQTELERHQSVSYEQFGDVNKDINSLRKLINNGLFPPADLAILVNPATEALQAKMLIESMCNDKSFIDVTNRLLNGKRRPWLIAMKSTSDKATGAAFKVMTTVAADFPMNAPPNDTPYKESSDSCSKMFSEESQRKFVTHTAPDLPEMHTHRLIRSSEQVEDDGLNTETELDGDESLLKGVFEGYKQASNTGIDAIENEILRFRSDSSEYRLYRKKVVDKMNISDYSDYWAFDIPPEIVDGHSDIFQGNFGRLLGALIRSQTAPICSEPTPPKISTESNSLPICPELDENSDYCAVIDKFYCLKTKIATIKSEMARKT